MMRNSLPGYLCLLTLLLSGCGAKPPALEHFTERLVQQGMHLGAVPVVTVQAPAAGASSAEWAQWALYNAQFSDADDSRQLLLSTAALFERLDPVWGGILEQVPAAGEGRAEDSLLATRLDTQSLALAAFATAYWTSGEQRFETAFLKVDGYVQDWLRYSDGNYGAGQAIAPPTLRAPITVTDYWRLRREHDRRQLGIAPLVGRASGYSLAGLAHSYLLAADAFSQPNYLAEAQRLLQQLWPGESAVTKAEACGALPRVLRLLLAVPARANATQPVVAAGQLATQIMQARADDPLCTGVQAPAIPLALAHAELAQALLHLAIVERNMALGPALAPLLGAANAQAGQLSQAEQLSVATATAQLRRGFVVATISGQASDPRALALTQAARRSWQPRKIINSVTLADAVLLGLPNTPAVYLCSARQCEAPLLTPEAVSAAIAERQAPEQLELAEQLSSFLGNGSLGKRNARPGGG